MHQSSYQVYFDTASDTVEQIEVFGPSADGQAEGEQPSVTVLFGTIDLFRTPSAEVIGLIDSVLPVADRHMAGEEAIDWPHLGLSLWNEDQLHPPVFFESASVLQRHLFEARDSAETYQG